MSDILNKGIPVSPFNRKIINLNDLIESSNDKNKTYEFINNENLYNISYVESLLSKNYYSNFPYKTCISIYFDKDKKENYLVMEPFAILLEMFRLLGLDEYMNDLDTDPMDPEILGKILDKIGKLKNIRVERKLEVKFPELYKLFLEKKNQAILIRDKSKRESIKKAIQKEFGVNYDNELKNNIECALKISKIENFCEFYANLFDEIILNYPLIKDKYLSRRINLFENCDFDKDKTEFLIAYNYLTACSKCDTLDEKQKYLYYINEYIKEHKDDLYSDIIYTFNGQNYSFKDLYTRYIKELTDNPELKILDIPREEFKDFSYDEVEKYMDLELKDSRANWVFLEDGLDSVRIDRAINNTINSCTSTSKKKKTAEELRNLFLKKKELFEGLNKYSTVLGRNTFEGYVAYIFPNGKVILERFFKKKRNGEEVIAYDEAIYVMNIEDFDRLSRLPKQVLINNKLCNRYYHSGDWTSKIRTEIDSEGVIPASEYNKLLLEKKIVK